MIVADTHAWIWWASDSRHLSKRARVEFDAADEIGISAISCWEIAMLVMKNRLRLDRDDLLWLRQSLALPRAVLVPIDPEIATCAATLQRFHGDPADRLIAATTIVRSATLVTKDARLRDCARVRTVW